MIIAVRPGLAPNAIAVAVFIRAPRCGLAAKRTSLGRREKHKASSARQE
jgi:hypothetical protein